VMSGGHQADIYASVVHSSSAKFCSITPWPLLGHNTCSREPAAGSQPTNCTQPGSLPAAVLRTWLPRVLLLEARECHHLLPRLLAAAVSQVLQEAACSLRGACSSTHTVCV
jgi:hypothetical protein